MSVKWDRGHSAELFVAERLRSKGYIIAKMNYRSRFGEIDIIAENRTTIAFVEVKLRDEDFLVSPAQAVDENKQQKIILTAKDYLSKAHLDNLQPRFDVAEVLLCKGADGKKKFKVHYIKDAFQA